MNGKRRILILDFDERLLITLERLLEDAGFSATTTWDVAEGFALMQSGCFDFLVVGNRPPELDAHGLIAELRREGLNFGDFVLGEDLAQDEYGNLVDRIRSFPFAHLGKPVQTEKSSAPHERVCHGR